MVIADELSVLDDADARAAEAAVLSRAGGLTTGALRAALRRAVEAVDPAAAGRRRRAARKEAGVQIWPEASGNSCLAGRELPPAEAVAADSRLTAQARWLKERGAQGTIGQLRQAVFSALLGGRPVDSLLPGPAASGRDRPGPGRLVPDGPVPDGPAGSRPAAGGPDTDAPAGGGVGTGEPPGWTAITGTVNLIMPLAAWEGRSEAPGEVPGFGTADAGTCRDLARSLAASPQAQAQWCLTITDGNGRAVAHACARQGPGPPGAPLSAGWLAGLRLQILESGTCGHGRQASGYVPPRSLRHLVTTRQRTCGFPGCRRPAVRCDADHDPLRPGRPDLRMQPRAVVPVASPGETGPGLASRSAPARPPDLDPPTRPQLHHRSRSLSCLTALCLPPGLCRRAGAPHSLWRLLAERQPGGPATRARIR